MTGAHRAGMDIAFLGAMVLAVAARRAGNRALSRRQRLEDRVEPVDHGRVAADHHAIAALQPPDAAGGADIDIGDAQRRQFGGAALVVLVEAVAAVDDDIARREQ